MNISVSAPSENAQQVINKRYSLKSESGEPIEDWNNVCSRVSRFVSQAETNEQNRAEFVNNVLPLMQERKFLPNTPCLVNAGKPNAQLAGCFVLPVEDSIKGIMKTASDSALIHQSGGGTGFTFGNLRPAGSVVNTTHGIASGPISFMEIFDKVTDVVKQGGVRRGANMGVFPCNHPDILRFIHAKNDQHTLTNFNISVAITDEFMEAVKAEDYEQQFIQCMFNGKPWLQPIYDPKGDLVGSHAQAGKIHAPTIWQRIIESAWKWGEPGVQFIDTVNKHNLLKSLGDITASNPCSEQFLHDYNSCNLGSIDVSKFYLDNNLDYPEAKFDWESFQEAVYWTVRFLDNVIDVCNWPLPEIDEMVKRTRPVGLGIMGFADLLLKLGIRYGSSQCLEFLGKLMQFFQREAWRSSCLLGQEKGTFPELENNQDLYNEFLAHKVFGQLTKPVTPRNYEVTTIAPTGTISLVAETSSGIEPNFAWSFKRVDTVGERDYVHPMVVERNFNLPDYFVTAHDLSSEEHVRVLAIAQQYVDNGVSKTCNGHSSDTVDDVKRLYELAYSLGVKSMSYYRDGSRNNQVLQTKKKCPECQSELNEGKCDVCPKCGWSLCNM